MPDNDRGDRMPDIERSSVDLGRSDERNAWERGRDDAEAGRPLNEPWLWRRVGVARAYRDGYEGRPLGPTWDCE